MQLFSIDQLKQAVEAKVRHRRMLERIKQQRQRALRQLEEQIIRVQQEERLLQQEIRQQQQDTLKKALENKLA